LLILAAVGVFLWRHRTDEAWRSQGWGHGRLIQAGEGRAHLWRLVPGVGVVRARDLARMADDGRLRCPDDLTLVPGIGPKTAAAVSRAVAWGVISEGMVGGIRD